MNRRLTSYSDNFSNSYDSRRERTLQRRPQERDGSSSRSRNTSNNSAPTSRQKQSAPMRAPKHQRQMGPSNQRRQNPNNSRGARPQNNAYNMPQVWTQGPNRYAPADGNPKTSNQNVSRKRPSLLSNKRNRLIFSIIIAIALVFGVDYLLNHNKIYEGISVGTVDVSGMTIEEAAVSISKEYSEEVKSKAITIYAGSALDAYDVNTLSTNDLTNISSQVKDASALKDWATNATELDAAIAAYSLAEEAYNTGRSDGLIFARIAAFFAGINIAPRVTMSEKGVESLAHTIDVAVGKPHVESGISITEGVCSPTQGEDGMEVNRDTFTNALQEAFLSEETTTPSIAVKVEYAPCRISFEKAQVVSDQVNASISYGCIFYYQSIGWEIKKATLGNWIDTKIEQVNNEWELIPYVSPTLARSSILAQVKEWVDQPLIRIQFEKNNDTILVKTDGSFNIPQIDDAIETLSETIFEGSTAPSKAPQITIKSVQAPTSMSLEDALNNGIVSAFMSYTTEYTNEVDDQARNHNIHLMADKLNNSIVKADGGIWSFHGTAGESNAAAGFIDAGIILDGVYTEDVGGGICQAATTVFNAVYEAGFPIPVRYNHSLYIASYPAGRDAAVNWPDLDLKWKNDSSSDVLLTMSYTDTSITCTLYGVSPGYLVTTQTGEWEEGEKAETKEIVDPTLKPGEKVVKQKPSDGRKIWIVRTVTDGNGVILHQDTFSSTYQPKNEIIMVGPEE